MKKPIPILLSALLLCSCAAPASPLIPADSKPTASVSEVSASSKGSASSKASASSKSAVSEPPVSSAPSWEETYNPANGWKFSKYKNVDVNPDCSELDGQTVCQIATCTDVTYVLTTEGRVYATGINRHKQLGQGTFGYLYGLQEVDLPEPIRRLYTGNCGCIALGESNTMYLWGRIIDHSADESLDTRGTDVIAVPFDQPIADIAFQLRKITLLTEDGSVYAFGEAFRDGMITEHGDCDGYYWRPEDLLVPQPVVLPEKIVQIDASEQALYWLGESGALYLAYNGGVVEFPCTPLKENPYARKINSSVPFVSMTAGLNNILLQDRAGTVYALGVQVPPIFPIGVSESKSRIANSYNWSLNQPYPLKLNFKVSSVGVMPANATFFLVADNGEVYAIGESFWDWALTGVTDVREIDRYYCSEKPLKMQLPLVSEFYARGNTYYFIDRADGKLYTAGYNMYGTALGAKRAPDGSNALIETPVAVPIALSDDFHLNG